MGDKDAPVGCFTVSWWTGGAVVTTGYCILVSRVVWVIPMLRHLLNLQAWHFFLLVGVIWHVRASPRDLQLNVSNLFPTWDKSLEKCSLISTKISPKICGRKLCKRSMKWWSTNCSGTVKYISVIIRRNILLLVTLVALSPHTEHFPPMLPVPGPARACLSTLTSLSRT